MTTPLPRRPRPPIPLRMRTAEPPSRRSAALAATGLRPPRPIPTRHNGNRPPNRAHIGGASAQLPGPTGVASQHPPLSVRFGQALSPRQWARVPIEPPADAALSKGAPSRGIPITAQGATMPDSRTLSTTRPNRVEVEFFSTTTAVIALAGEHDLATSDTVKEALTLAASRRRHMIVDVSACTFLDSTVISMLVWAHYLITSHKGRFALVLPDGSAHTAR